MLETIDEKILIEEISIPTKGIGKYFSIKTVNHTILGEPPSFYWQVYEQIVESKPGEQSLKYPGACLLDGGLYMTSQEYALWGTDDNYVIDWALNKLNFKKL